MRDLARLLKSLFVGSLAVFLAVLLANAITGTRETSQSASLAQISAPAIPAAARAAPTSMPAPAAPAHPAIAISHQQFAADVRRAKEADKPWDAEYARLEPVAKRAAGKRLLDLGLGQPTGDPPDRTPGHWSARIELYAPRDGAARCGEIAKEIMARRPEIVQVIASAYSDRQQDRCVFSGLVYADGHEDVWQAGPAD